MSLTEKSLIFFTSFQSGHCYNTKNKDSVILMLIIDAYNHICIDQINVLASHTNDIRLGQITAEKHYE